jgi:hypothetical protein
MEATKTEHKTVVRVINKPEIRLDMLPVILDDDELLYSFCHNRLIYVHAASHVYNKCKFVTATIAEGAGKYAC